jgi:hypothetical protein
MTSCADSTMAAYVAAGGLAQGHCGMFLFFIFDTLSFSFLLGCVVVIVTLSIPQAAYIDSKLETGGIWLRLAVIWTLWYVAVAMGFGTLFCCRSKGCLRRVQRNTVLDVLVPGILLLVLGLWIILDRLCCLFPGWRSVGSAASHMVGCGAADVTRKPSGGDVEVSELLTSNDFWQRASASRAASSCQGCGGG